MAGAEEIAARLERLKKARASGVLRVTHGDVTTEFRNGADLDRAIAAEERELAAAQGNAPRRTFFITSDKGL
jgi:hypothetical protein